MSAATDPPERVEPAESVPDAERPPGGHHDEELPRHLLEHRPLGDQAHPIDATRSIDRGEGAMPAAPQPLSPEAVPAPAGDDPSRSGVEDRRPLIERVGMAAIALVLAALFGGVALAAFSGGEPFLAAMGAIGCLMTLWVGALTLFRG